MRPDEHHGLAFASISGGSDSDLAHSGAGEPIPPCDMAVFPVTAATFRADMPPDTASSPANCSENNGFPVSATLAFRPRSALLDPFLRRFLGSDWDRAGAPDNAGGPPGIVGQWPEIRLDPQGLSGEGVDFRRTGFRVGQWLRIDQRRAHAAGGQVAREPGGDKPNAGAPRRIWARVESIAEERIGLSGLPGVVWREPGTTTALSAGESLRLAPNLVSGPPPANSFMLQTTAAGYTAGGVFRAEQLLLQTAKARPPRARLQLRSHAFRHRSTPLDPAPCLDRAMAPPDRGASPVGLIRAGAGPLEVAGLAIRMRDRSQSAVPDIAVDGIVDADAGVLDPDSDTGLALALETTDATYVLSVPSVGWRNWFCELDAHRAAPRIRLRWHARPDHPSATVLMLQRFPGEGAFEISP